MSEELLFLYIYKEEDKRKKAPTSFVLSKDPIPFA